MWLKDKNLFSKYVNFKTMNNYRQYDNLIFRIYKIFQKKLKDFTYKNFSDNKLKNNKTMIF